MFDIMKLPVRRGNVPLRVARGHFATNHSHINYYIDITQPKTCLADELTKSGFRSVNNHETIYVVEPEFGVNNQMLFRDNIQPMIRNKHVLVLMASCTTGYTAKKGIETIGYYGGKVVGVAALYSMVKEVCGQEVHSVFNMDDLPDYASYDYLECPYCKAGKKIDALVNSHGYSWL